MANALKQYPVIFNTGGVDTQIFQWDKWEERFDKVQTTNTSEAGTDLVNLVRVGKMVVSCEYSATYDWLAIFQTFNDLSSFTLKRYDASANAYKSHTVRMENMQVSIERHSDYVTQSTGLYTVSFDLIEF